MKRDILKRIVGVLVLQALFGALMFIGAGTLHFPRAWGLLGLSLVLFTANLIYVYPRNPEAIAARGKNPEGTKPFDRVFGLFFGLAVLGMHLCAGLDTVRWGEPHLGLWGLGIGTVLLVLGDLPIAWAMATNPHLEKTVRIQDDRGHKVISHGPYALVRHPMYTGIITQYVGTALYFGSSWVGVAAAVAILALVVRTALEDRTLQAELDGYAAFARDETRYRLLPGVW